ncbi:fam-g protein [Plasmodium gallinaceum]|uniref:Fam-g protein n=1 Tax=Plasmodium gallinaceum TaxID=5849 RepID=A0A1J1GQC5_PLAGA|nr:fam-g protein [Plasmodium gallinaceum]CRG94504.1 fam-g protein [Plasmodium gallinaceum]
MKTFTLYMKISTLFLLIWMFQFFYNYDSSKSLLDQNTLNIKSCLNYERMLAEGSTSECEEQSDAEEFVEENSSDEEDSEVKDVLALSKDVKDRWSKLIDKMWEQYQNETSMMSKRWRGRKWHIDWHIISSKKINDLHTLILELGKPSEERRELIDKTFKELQEDFSKFLHDCKEEWKKQPKQKKKVKTRKRKLRKTNAPVKEGKIEGKKDFETLSKENISYKDKMEGKKDFETLSKENISYKDKMEGKKDFETLSKENISYKDKIEGKDFETLLKEKISYKDKIEGKKDFETLSKENISYKDKIEGKKDFETLSKENISYKDKIEGKKDFETLSKENINYEDKIEEKKEDHTKKCQVSLNPQEAKWIDDLKKTLENLQKKESKQLEEANDKYKGEDFISNATTIMKNNNDYWTNYLRVKINQLKDQYGLKGYDAK